MPVTVEFDQQAYRQRNIVERPGGLAQGKPTHLLPLREDSQKLRRHDEDGLYSQIPATHVRLAFSDKA